MRFMLTVQMDNVAFDDPHELPRVLRELAAKIDAAPEAGEYQTKDVNGNTCARGWYIGATK